MKKTALVFPGQGSQYSGMAKDLCQYHTDCAALARQADEILGYSLTSVMFDGDDAVLRQTRYTQPAIFLHSMLAAQFIDRSDVAITAGHSLGEFSALCYSGVLSFEDALWLVAKRGDLMQRAGETVPGSMAAIVGLDEPRLNALLADASEFGLIQAANFNSPGQIVISGEVAPIKKAVELAKKHGAKLAKELSVSGAFHSPLMKAAEAEFAEAVERVSIQDADIPVCMNVNAQLTVRADDIKRNIVLQLTRPVLWQQSIEAMIAAGVNDFIEAGPQKVLQGLIKRINASVTLAGIDTAADAEQVADASMEKAA